MTATGSERVLGAIDIGSNAVRLQIDYVRGSGPAAAFRRAAFVRVPLRLGQEVFTGGRIGEEMQRQLCRAAIEFARLLRNHGVERYLAYATSAMREATNGLQVVSAIRESSGLEVEIIDGEKEADTLLAALPHFGGPCLHMDVGGGSTEVVLFSSRCKMFSRSFPIGTVRMLEGSVTPEDMVEFENLIGQLACEHAPVRLLGSGGNIRRIRRMLHAADSGTVQTAALEKLYVLLASMSVRERMEFGGLNSDRAEVIVPAMRIFLVAVRACGLREIDVPGVGLADGMIRLLCE